jgi:molecular chaperone HscB
VLDTAKNYFELFDLPVRFDLDVFRLAERFRMLQASPTDAPVAGGREAALAPFDTQTVEVQQAYCTLRDPLARAEYLLGLLAGGADSDAESGAEGAYLVEQLELREALAELGNRSQPQAAVAEVLTELAERSAALSQELHALFADPSAENLESAREVVRELRLLERCQLDARGLEAGVGQGSKTSARWRQAGNGSARA